MVFYTQLAGFENSVNDLFAVGRCIFRLLHPNQVTERDGNLNEQEIRGLSMAFGIHVSVCWIRCALFDSFEYLALFQCIVFALNIMFSTFHIHHWANV